MKSILKIILTLFILILLVTMFQVSFNFFQRLFIGNTNYYMIASPYTIFYGIIASLIITFLLFLLLFKSKAEDYIPYIFNKKVLPIVIVFLIFSYVYSLFKINVVYDNYIKTYSLFNLSGSELSFDQVEKVNIKIEKNIFQSFRLYYEIKFKNKKVEIFNSASDFGLELERFDHVSILNNNFENKNIVIEKDSKNLDLFLATLNKKEKENIKNLFN